MAAVDMAREDSATQLFTEKNQRRDPRSSGVCVLMSEGMVGHHVNASERVHCDSASSLAFHP